MDKKRLYHIIEWTVALAACLWLIWKMVTYDDYPALWESLSSMGWSQYVALLICVLLMPVNMCLEAWRWKTLMNVQGDKEQCTKGISFAEAQRQVYYSKLAGLVTPWRLGEYPARGVLEVQRDNVQSTKDVVAKVLSMGAVGSATMTAAIVIAGLAGIGLFIGMDKLDILDSLGWTYYLLIGVIVVLLFLSLYFAPRLLKRWATVSHRLILISLAQSLIRLLCWCVQLALVLYALGAIYNLQFTIYNLPIYYLLVTITPNVPIAEVGVRGAWAILLFGSMNAMFAGVLLWVINTLLPCLIWPFLRKNEK